MTTAIAVMPAVESPPEPLLLPLPPPWSAAGVELCAKSVRVVPPMTGVVFVTTMTVGWPLVWPVGVSVVTWVIIRVVEGAADGAVEVVVSVSVVLAGTVLVCCCVVLCCVELSGVEVEVSIGVDDCGGVDVDAGTEDCTLELLIFATAIPRYACWL